MTTAHQTMIDAILAKTSRFCPEAVDLIGLYGSVLTGDVHERSDLDLLILTRDDRGYVLADAFILDDLQIGYDIYCTTWQMLEDDAECRHAYLSKLMDSRIIYVREEAALQRLNTLRERAAAILGSDARFERVESIVRQIIGDFAKVRPEDSLGALRCAAADAIYYALDAVMLRNGRYFKRGVKRTFEELEGLPLPLNFRENIERMVRADHAEDLYDVTRRFTENLADYAGVAYDPHPEAEPPAANSAQPAEKPAPTPDDLRGTYEEMYSNWRNKMYEAAARGDAFSSFMNLASLYYMLQDIADSVRLPDYAVMDQYDPTDLAANARLFDEVLERYGEEYAKLGLQVRRFRNAQEFAREYVGGEG